jgi:hypothetical protein
LSISLIEQADLYGYSFFIKYPDFKPGNVMSLKNSCSGVANITQVML